MGWLLVLFAIAAGLLASAPTAHAQSNWSRVAVPYYSPVHVLQGLHAHWNAPRAGEFASRAKALTGALRQLCAAPAPADAQLAAARQNWRDTMIAWEKLAAVPTGPLIERRSLRGLDFAPTRPSLIERAIAGMKPGADPALDHIGTPAKGLPALEWLLWTKPAAPGSPACRYAIAIAGEIEREAAAIHAAFTALAARAPEAWTEEAAIAAVTEFVNQWIGGLERLRWLRMEKPMRAGRPEELPRAASRETAASWAAEWEALRTLALFQGSAPPAPGAGLVPLEVWLRGRGLNPIADRLVRTVRGVDARMQKLAPAPRAREAAKELAALKRLSETAVAPALEVRIGFSDADGD